jgi:RNA polymerase sigma-70 factor (ECF subfamily)
MTDPLEQLAERLLVLRCQAGDESAFAELVERYSPRLRYFVRRMTDGDPDDLLQEVWIDVFRGLPRLADTAAFPAWIYRLTRDRVARDYRGRRHVPEPLLDSDPPAEDEPDFSAEDAGRIHSAMGELPAEQREVLVLRFLEGMSYDDMSGVIGCPLGTVRSRLYYAKQALRRILERKGEHG